MDDMQQTAQRVIRLNWQSVECTLGLYRSQEKLDNGTGLMGVTVP